MPSSLTRTTIASVAAHALAAAVLIVVARAQPDVDPLAGLRPADTVDLDFVAPPPPPPPVAPPPTPAPTPEAARPEPTRPEIARPEIARPEPARADRSARTALPGPVSPTAPEPSGPVAPAPAAPAPAAPAPAMSGLRLLTQVTHDANAAAAAGVVDLGPVNEAGPARQDLFGGRRGRPTADDIRTIASSPTTTALADSQHMVAPGTITRDRTIARRAAEVFSPARTVAHLGAIVANAPLHSVPPATRTPGAAEVAATEGLDIAHGQSFTMATGLVNVPTPPYHLVRADVEIDQDATGAVVSARVVRSSGSSGFDEAALRAIREAVPAAADATTPSGGARRTRWAFEVSNAASAGSRLLGNGNEGWQMLGDEVDGMHLRMRVRVIARSAL